MTFVPFNGFIVIEVPNDTDFAKSAGGLFMPGALNYTRATVRATSEVLLEDGTTRACRVAEGAVVYVMNHGGDDGKPGLPCPDATDNRRLVREADIVGFVS